MKLAACLLSAGLALWASPSVLAEQLEYEVIIEHLSSDAAMVKNLRDEGLNLISDRAQQPIEGQTPIHAKIRIDIPELYATNFLRVAYRSGNVDDVINVRPPYTATPGKMTDRIVLVPLAAVGENDALVQCTSPVRGNLETSLTNRTVCREAFRVRIRNGLWFQTKTMQFFKGWFDASYEVWKLKKGGYVFEPELGEYVKEYRRRHKDERPRGLPQRTFFERSEEAYDNFLREIEEGDLKLYNTAIAYWNSGYPDEAVALMCVVRDSFDRLSEKYQKTVLDRITRQHIEGALAKWGGETTCPL